MKDIELGSDALGPLVNEVDASLAADREPAWRPAFAAADAKVLKEETMLEEPLSDAAIETASAAGVATEAGAAVASAGGFLALVKGWLGRA